MLKIRMMGSKDDLKWFSEFLRRNNEVDVLEISDAYENKGTSKYCRVYVEVEKKTAMK